MSGRPELRRSPAECSMGRCVILHVEDDDATAYLFSIALREAGLNPRLFRVTSGESASAFLAKVYPYENAATPDIVVLDLNLPGKSGFDVLAEAKARPETMAVPFFVFSTSRLQSDRDTALALGADRYTTKPDNFEEFVNAVKGVCIGCGVCPDAPYPSSC